MPSSVRKRQAREGISSSLTDGNSKGKRKEKTFWTTGKLVILGAVLIAFSIFLGVLYARNNPDAIPANEPQKRKSKAAGAKKSSSQKKGSIPLELINQYDRKILKELEEANKKYRSGRADRAVQGYQILLQKYGDSPYAKYGKAQALERHAEELRSNEVLQQSIDTYQEVSNTKECPRELSKLSYLRMTDRYEFLGKLNQALKAMKKLAVIFPDDITVLNKLGVHHLLAGSNDGAVQVFRKVLEINPSNGFAKSHLGFVLKSQLKLEESVPLLKEGIGSGEQGADHARFYFHLGDAYSRLGKPDEAWKIYEDGAAKGIFMSAWQRSLYNADTQLKAQPWWDPRDSGHLKAIRKLEANWKTIRDEGLAMLDTKSGGFIPEEENLREKGDWLQFTLYQQGRKSFSNCRKTPKTCALLDSMPEAVGCKRGQIKYSVMHPGTHVWPHCGPTNCRLRAHLGLVIPNGVSIRCGTEKKVWKEGKVIIIDDSFDHEVWHNGSTFRLILIIDFWHPDLTARQKAEMTPI